MVHRYKHLPIAKDTIFMKRNEFLSFMKDKDLYSYEHWGHLLDSSVMMKVDKKMYLGKNPWFYQNIILPKSTKVQVNKKAGLHNGKPVYRHEFKGYAWHPSFNEKNGMYYLTKRLGW